MLLSLDNLSWIAGDPRQGKEKAHSLGLFSIFNPRTVAHAIPPPLPPQKGKKANKQLTVNKAYGAEEAESALTQLLQPPPG